MVSAVLWSSLGAARAVEEDKRAGAAFLVACSVFSSSGARDLWWVRVALSLALVVSSGGRFGPSLLAPTTRVAVHEPHKVVACDSCAWKQELRERRRRAASRFVLL